jgi:hypothetical protein
MEGFFHLNRFCLRKFSANFPQIFRILDKLWVGQPCGKFSANREMTLKYLKSVADLCLCGNFAESAENFPLYYETF